MISIFTFIVRARKRIIITFILLSIVCFFLNSRVHVNYDLYDFLPEDSPSTVALNVMEEEFEGAIPNARAMVKDVTIPEALQIKEKLLNTKGVTDVTWLDDVCDVTIPVSMQDMDTWETYYKNGCALFTITVSENHRIHAINTINKIIGENGALTGAAVSTVYGTLNTIDEARKTTIFSVALVLLILAFATTSWAEPFVILIGLGVAIIISRGTNILFDEISFVSNAAGAVLQLAVSLDYSVFLIHRFEECQRSEPDPEKAMIKTLSLSAGSISSSGLTTVIGFMALLMMRFLLGRDLGLVLSKGVAISLITVFVFMPGLILMTYPLMQKTKHRRFTPSFSLLGHLVQKIRIPAAILFILIVVPSFLASNANMYYYGSSHLFADDSKYGVDTRSIDDTFGERDTYVLMVPKGDREREVSCSAALRKYPQVKDIVSYVDTVGPEIPSSYLDEETLKKLESDRYSRMVLTVETPREGKETFALISELEKTIKKYYKNTYYLAGDGVTSFDLKTIVTEDMLKVNIIAILAVLIVLIATMRDFAVPVILVLCIETAIWINLSIPYFMDSYVFYIAYLIISSVQLGATVDYAILVSGRYKEDRLRYPKKDIIVQVIKETFVSIMVSGSALMVVGLLLGIFSSNMLIAQLGVFVGRGAILSLCIVAFILPGVLVIFDRIIMRGKGLKNENAIH